MPTRKHYQSEERPGEEHSPLPSRSKSLFNLGVLAIDRQRHLVTVSDQRVDLSPTEYEIVVYLADKLPQVVSAQELAHHLYGYNMDAQEASALIRNNIYRIRAKFGVVPEPGQLIRTVRGVGYTLQLPEKTKESDPALVDARYRLLHLIGQGATATVYKAYQESLDRYVAIKFLRSSLPEEDTFQKRFRLEARHVASLQHPNIVQVYDFGDKDGNYYIVMEFIEGQTLETKLSELESFQQRLPLLQALQIIRETGRALAYAHRQGMIHRDIKPGNIMITPDGRVVLMDFGLAKLVAAPHITAEGSLSGTPNYMAPEQIRGLPLDTRLDIYGLGAVMYQLITGRLPFIAENELGVLFQHVKDIPPLPSLFVPNLAEGIEFITLKALAKQPAERYQTMEEMLADLDDPESVNGKVIDLLPSLKAAPLPPHYLPAPLTPFVPRQEEATAIQTRLAQPGIRLLTLLGIGGVGKTRLALEVGRNLLPTFSDGVFFVDLTSVQRAALLPGMIAHLVNMVEEGKEAVEEQLLAHLSKRQLLLILDNFEHILEAAPLASEILAAAPQCKILVTSREPLRLYGENLFPIAPLPLPNLRQQLAYDHLRDYTAVQLFAARAQAVAPDFALTPENIQQVAELCIQLDGLPLALELAASQAYVFSPSELVAQLKNRLALLSDGPRDRAARQQTMRGAIDWSYDLLNEEEQKAFNRLGIFAGRFSAEAAVEIVGPVNLEGLAQKSLLQQEVGHDGRPRFWMLQLLREYALEQLKTDPAFEPLQQQHAAFYLRRAETAEPHLTGPDQEAWFTRLEEDHDNFRAILHRSLQENTPETALRVSAVLWRLWAVHSYLSEGALWLDAILNETAGFKTSLQAKVLFGTGRLALFQHKLARASQLFNESLALSEELQDQPAQATLLNSLGEIALQQADYNRADLLFHSALRLFQTSGDKAGVVQTLTHLGQLAFHQGRYEQAHNFLLQSLELGEEVGTPEAIAIVLNGLGEIARIQKRYEAAAAYYGKSLALYQQLNYSMGQAATLHNLAQVKLAQEQFQAAAALFRQSLSLLATMEEKVYIGWNLAGLAAALLNLGNPKHAVRLFSVTQALFEQFGGQLDPPDQAVYDRHLAESKKKLPEREWQQAWLEGQTIPIESELLDIIALTPILPAPQTTWLSAVVEK